MSKQLKLKWKFFESNHLTVNCDGIAGKCMQMSRSFVAFCAGGRLWDGGISALAT